MKKIILSTLVVFSLASCKKESQKNEEGVATTDSTTVLNKTETAKVELKEISQQNLVENLSKKNDTLYVTNFFATWCGPCMMEIPHFKKKIEELKGKPVKFTFVDILDKAAWKDKVPAFAKENNLENHIVLVDESKFDDTFFGNFKTWKGNGIPFTHFRKGDKTEEVEGSMSEEMLNEKINSLLK
ncbi:MULTISPECIES: TlpA family protein disulfide reductase [Chryseobacterium]|jgi:thiol-disulfide isomerase/thioredoxin|uniref:Thioredoxin n=3 Tax=Chryseobacterium TaxID=59732 RepID=A0A1N7KGW5_9FLAO|nr:MULTISPECIES: TlpA disulfide reductase family protein [Chryseobacterium]MBL7879344.1 redoxin domain-containing protein [Chryseobacterium gambrini]PVV56373.1 redoxin [Chryseobacterium sp. HMWF035]SIS60842.1 Thioredoxin [Chryseobacterium gambrini]